MMIVQPGRHVGEAEPINARDLVALAIIAVSVVVLVLAASRFL